MKSLARFLLFLLLILVLFAGFIFTLNNSAAVPLWLGTALNPRPLGIWVLLAFIAGGLAGLLLGLLGLWQRFRQRIEVHQLKKRLQQAEMDLAILKQSAHSPNNGPHDGSVG
jgi:uncharacterized integral membrane protein